jgi:hypothetical protein
VVSKTLILSGKRLDKTIPHFPSHSNEKRRNRQHIRFTISEFTQSWIDFLLFLIK